MGCENIFLRQPGDNFVVFCQNIPHVINVYILFCHEHKPPVRKYAHTSFCVVIDLPRVAQEKEISSYMKRFHDFWKKGITVLFLLPPFNQVYIVLLRL